MGMRAAAALLLSCTHLGECGMDLKIPLALSGIYTALIISILSQTLNIVYSSGTSLARDSRQRIHLNFNCFYANRI